MYKILHIPSAKYVECLDLIYNKNELGEHINDLDFDNTVNYSFKTKEKALESLRFHKGYSNWHEDSYIMLWSILFDTIDGDKPLLECEFEIIEVDDV